MDPATVRPLFTIGELARRTGMATSALRFYEAEGLIGAVRTDSGHRRFYRSTTRRVAFILFAQRLGLTLDEIRTELNSLPRNAAPDRSDWLRLSRNWNARVDERIAQLERLKRDLTDCIGCGCLSLERCHVLNPGDAAAALGPGPRWWLGDQPLTHQPAAHQPPSAQTSIPEPEQPPLPAASERATSPPPSRRGAPASPDRPDS